MGHPQAPAVVITGSTRGIGLGLAREFLQRGSPVMISGRSRQSVDQALEQLGQTASPVYGQPCDVTCFEQHQALWDSAVAQFGAVDYWINNAGLARTNWPILETPIDYIHDMVTTNLFGTLFGSRVAAAGMQAAGSEPGRKIFNILGGGSDGEYFPGIAVYGTTKRGLDYFSRALAKELKPSGILVGRVRPGMIISDAVVREARERPEAFQKSRRMMNILVDRIETAAPYLVDRMLNFRTTGGKIRWLTGGKIARRMLMARFRTRPDQFEDFGL